jgi:translation initiation factor 1A
MVKNTHGGSGHKKFASKHSNAPKNNKLRISEDEGEIYAIVTKMLGNSMFHCYCLDGITRLGHIRGKFSGRGKRDNMVESGKWVLIGLREWDVPSEKITALSKGKGQEKEKLQQCDLLEVYSDTDKERLKDTVTENWLQLENNDVTKKYQGDNSGEKDIIFSTEREFERDRLIEEMKSSTMEKITFKIEENENTEEEVNIDDI